MRNISLFSIGLLFLLSSFLFGEEKVVSGKAVVKYNLQGAPELHISTSKDMAKKKFKVVSGKTPIANGEMNSSKGTVILPDSLPGYNCLKDVEIIFEDGSKIKGASTDAMILNQPLVIKTSWKNDKLIAKADLDKKLAWGFFNNPLRVGFEIYDKKWKKFGEKIVPVGQEAVFTCDKDKVCYLETTLLTKNWVFAGRKIISLKKESSASTKPVTIAMGGIADHTPFFGYYKTILSLRDSAVVELLNNYNCVVLNRSNGFALADESSLNRLNSLAKGNSTELEDIAAADYVINGYYEAESSAKSERNAVVKGTLLIHDLKKNGDFNYKKFQFDRCKGGAYYENLAPAIIKRLRLGQNNKSLPRSDSKKETWMIAPFKDLSFDFKGKINKNFEISTMIELALQNSGKIGKIVDHNEINNILQELKINARDFSAEDLSSGLAKITGADLVLTGQIRSTYRPEALGVDIFLIDGKNSVILAGMSALTHKDDLYGTAAALALHLASNGHISPDLEKASQKQMDKEADIYLEQLKNADAHHGYLKKLRWQINDYIGAAYLTCKNNPVKSYKLALSILNSHRRRMGLNKKEEKIKFFRTAERLLAQIKYSPETPGPLIYRANWRVILDYENEKALELLEEHHKKRPNDFKYFAHHIWARCYINLNQYEKAAEHIEIVASDPNGWLGIMGWKARIYRKLNNEEKELEALKEKARRKDYVTWSEAIRMLQLQRKREGAAKALAFAQGHLEPNVYSGPEVQLEFAKCHLEMGNTGKAALIADQLKKLPKAKKRFLVDKTKFEKGLDELIKASGRREAVWKKASQIKKIPSKYKFYIQPVGSPKDSIIEKAAKIASDFYGVEVIVRPTIPAPEYPDSFKENRAQYEGNGFLKKVIPAVGIPEDAVYMVTVTDKDFFTGFRDQNVVYYSSIYGRLVSYYRFMGKADSSEVAELLAKAIISGFHRQYACVLEPLPDNLPQRTLGRLCRNSKCLLSGSCNQGLIKCMNMGFCEDCQELYKKVDFDKVHYVTQNMFRPLSVSTPEEKKWMKDYNRKVKRAVAGKEDRVFHPLESDSGSLHK